MISLKERPGFETYLSLNNQKLCQAITELQISTHKSPIETDHYDQKTQIKRTYPWRCEGNEAAYIFECKNKEIIKIRNECLAPFKTRKVRRSYQQKASAGKS